ncbi:hypothetical protein U5A82_01540 [Sphingobium sp. CR2-8]|uniref:hypothetical protein n=1 Tax=Sphingobium sp. CR2-8 TaxID=1306534 RepID=UPI002DBA305A|nr:hypothetical protein [Sphingobium sp. CR2-8]MEC3909200.1 hypothetical protein [Sphingobium sp. CR2-8]
MAAATIVVVPHPLANVGGMRSGGTIMPLLDSKKHLRSSDPLVIVGYVARTAPIPAPGGRYAYGAAP